VKIELAKGQRAPQEAILALEARLGARLSESFRSFVDVHDGAEPSNNVFRLRDNDSAGVNEFIPVIDVWKQRAYIENIPTKAYPIRSASGGNYVLIDEGQNGAVFFGDHEPPDKLTKLAGSFAAFLELLESFDPDSIQLKPGQVERVWIDP
jgi:hypothetical protein